MPLGTEVGLDPDENPAAPEKGHSPHVLVHVYCGQMAGQIDMSLGAKVGLMVDGHPPPRPKTGAVPPIFGPCLLSPNGRPSRLLLGSCWSFITRT